MVLQLVVVDIIVPIQFKFQKAPLPLLLSFFAATWPPDYLPLRLALAMVVLKL